MGGFSCPALDVSVVECCGNHEAGFSDAILYRPCCD